jgi:enterochelin esterase-like enzyme
LVTSYPGSLVEGEIPVIVYLPKGFEEMGGQIPVIYLLHGLGYDEWMWVDLDVWTWVEQRPVVLIMPFIPQPLLSQTDGGPNSYETELLNGVIPYLEARFGLEPPHRAIAGISRGAVWALEISFRHPSTFEAVAALSPSLHLNRPRSDYDPRHIVAEGGPLPQQILLMAGEAERQTLAALELLVAELDAREASYRLEIRPGNHNEALWRGQLEEVLAMLTAEG